MDTLLQVIIPVSIVLFFAVWVMRTRKKKQELNKTDFDALGKKLGKKPWELKFEMGAELTMQDLKHLGWKGTITNAELVDMLDKKAKTVDELLEALDVLHIVVSTSLDWQELDHLGKKHVLQKKLYALIRNDEEQWDYVMDLRLYDHWHYKNLLERWKEEEEKEEAKEKRLSRIKNPKTAEDAFLFFDYFGEIPEGTDKEHMETEVVRILLKLEYDPARFYDKLHYQKSKRLLAFGKVVTR
jgi:hypothetical protein